MWRVRVSALFNICLAIKNPPYLAGRGDNGAQSAKAAFPLGRNHGSNAALEYSLEYAAVSFLCLLQMFASLSHLPTFHRVAAKLAIPTLGYRVEANASR